MTQTGVIVFGKSGCGKSTLCGHLLYQLGEFDDKALDAAKEATKTLNKPNSEYAFLCNTRDEDRKNGTTTTHLFTFTLSKHQYTLIDSCGASKNLNRLIRHGFGQSRVGVLVLEAYNDKDAFKSLIGKKSEVRQQLVIAHAFGIQEMAVCINKIDKDNINFNEALYKEYKESITNMLTSIGYNAAKVPIIPICSYSGDNIFECSQDPSLGWWKGYAHKNDKITTLVQGIKHLSEKAKPLNRAHPSSVTLCMSIKSRLEVKNVGTVFLARVDAGDVAIGQSILCCKSGETPSARKYNIKSLQTHGKNIKSAKCGAVVGFTLTPDIGTLEKDDQPQIGDVCCNGEKFKMSIIGRDAKNTDYAQAVADGIKYHDTFTALIIMLPEDVTGTQTLQINGKEFNNDVVFRSQTLNCAFKKILAKCKRKDNVLEETSGFSELTNDEQAEVVFSTKDKHFVSVYDEMNSYSRFVIMKDKKPIAIGKVVVAGSQVDEVLKDGLYRFEAVHSGKYIRVKENSKEEGKELVQYERSKKEEDVFDVKKQKNGCYTVQCKHSGLYWAIENESKDDHGKLIQSEFKEKDSQYFEITHFENSKYGIKAKHSQKSLDIAGGSKDNDAQIIQYSTHNGGNQLFFCVQ